MHCATLRGKMLGFVYHTHIQQNGGLFYTVLLVRAANHCYSQKIACINLGFVTPFPMDPVVYSFWTFYAQYRVRLDFFLDLKTWGHFATIFLLQIDLAALVRTSSFQGARSVPGESAVTSSHSLDSFTAFLVLSSLSFSSQFLITP